MSRHPAIFFHASPGGGKTFLFKQLYQKKFPTLPDIEQLNVFFIVADFNRSAAKEAQYVLKSMDTPDCRLFVLLRLYSVEFIDAHENKRYY